MTRKQRFILPAIVAFAFAATFAMVHVNAQATTTTGDFSNATRAEVRDAQGQIVLSGDFQQSDEEDDDVERKAVLAPAGGDADAAGDAEVEFSTDSPAEQEVEFAVRNVTPGAALTFVIDGVNVASATADSRGRAEVELVVRTGATGR